MAQVSRVIAAILICLFAGSVGAQSLETIDTSKLNFDSARVSFAGPSAFFLRNVSYGDQEIGFIVRLIDNEWKITELLSETHTRVPSNVVLDFARVEIDRSGILRLDGVLLDGVSYKVELSVNPDATLGLPNIQQSGALAGSSLQRAVSETGLVPREELELAQISRDQALAEVSRLGESLRRYEEAAAVSSTSEEPLASPPEDAVFPLKVEEKLADELEWTKSELSSLQRRYQSLLIELDQIKRTANVNPPADPETVKELQEFSERIATLEAMVQEQQSRIQALETLGLELGQEVIEAGEAARVAGEAARTAEAALEQARREAEARTASTPTAPSTAEVPAPEIEVDVAELVRTIEELGRTNAVLTQERNDIEAQIRRILAWDGYMALVRGDFTQQRLRGFAGSQAAMGTWHFSGDGVSQADPKQYFARLDLPLTQEGEALLYQFEARSTGSEWVGYGMHIYASGSQRRQGYGFGESLLVWLTRDPQVYGTDQTYLELYRSRDDVNMERVLHAAIEEPISQLLKIEILYQPQEEYLSIAVNGEEKIRYKTWFSVDKGVEVSLRSLGSAEFSGLKVLSRQD